MKKVVITGARGYIGRALANRLADDGLGLRLVSRGAETPLLEHRRATDVEWVEADLRDPRAWSPLIADATTVVHLPSRRVLLRWHPRMHQWMQVGGHFDAGETDPLVVALREAREETGLTDLRLLGGRDDGPMQIVIVPVPAGGGDPAHEHADFRYVLTTERPEAIVAESTAAQLRWVDLAVALAEATEDNLRVFLSRVSEALE